LSRRPRRVILVAVPPKSPYLEEITRLDPVADHKRITHLITCYEFPFDTTRALEMAFFRTYAVPTIGTLLDTTGEFAARAQKRYDDTDLIVSLMVEDGYDSDTGRRALRRMNQIHGRFDISNDDFLYVLSNFVFEPPRWIERFGWRKMVEHERLALFYNWREIGRRMNIKDIPPDYAAFERFNRDYEREHLRPTEAAVRVARAARTMFLSWFPGLPRRVGEQVISAMLDDPLLDAFGFPRPAPPVRRAVEAGLRARAAVVRALPPRSRPRLRTERRTRTYPRGYVVEELGPPEPARS
jgi:hypothetical protein